MQWIIISIFHSDPFTNLLSVEDPETDAESQRLTNATEHPQKKIRRKASGKWTSKIKRRIFILSWIHNYDKDTAIGDAIAGITLGLTMIPQAIAYAALAGLPSQYGLYSAFMGTTTWCSWTGSIEMYSRFVMF